MSFGRVNVVFLKYIVNGVEISGKKTLGFGCNIPLVTCMNIQEWVVRNIDIVCIFLKYCAKVSVCQVLFGMFI